MIELERLYQLRHLQEVNPRKFKTILKALPKANVARKNKPLIINKFLTTGGNILKPVGLNCPLLIINHF